MLIGPSDLESPCILRGSLRTFFPQHVRAISLLASVAREREGADTAVRKSDAGAAIVVRVLVTVPSFGPQCGAPQQGGGHRVEIGCTTIGGDRGLKARGGQRVCS